MYHPGSHMNAIGGEYQMPQFSFNTHTGPEGIPPCNHLPTPPNSTRTSLEESHHEPKSLCTTKKLAQVVVPLTNADLPPTNVDLPPSNLTPPPSPSTPVPPTYDSILKSFKSVADQTIKEIVVGDVPSATYEAVMAEAIKSGDWQSVRVDYHEGVLIVHCPGMGHEIIPELFDVMRCGGTSYPRNYNGSKITQGGSTTITLEAGMKSPDFSLYEVNDDESDGQVQKVIDTNPTIAFEVAYYGESSKKLSLDAGRLICLSKGKVQLVAAIDMKHKVDQQNDGTRKLSTVTWSHWEMDPEYPKEVGDGDSYELNKLIPEIDGVLQPGSIRGETPTAYRAVVTYAQTPHWVRAYISQTYELLPDKDIKEINILYRHLFRDPQEADYDRTAFSIKTAHIMATIHNHERVQRGIDTTKKKRREDVDSIDNQLLARLKKRRSGKK